MRRRLLLICLIVAVTCWFARHFAGEDALIYARYVRNALRGNGLVFNPGERVNALTSPLFAFILLGVSWLLHGRVLLAEFLLCGGFMVAACAMGELLAPWSGVLIASTAYFYFCMGMETFQFLFMLSLLTILYLNNRLNWLPLVALLTILTRFEGLALVAAVGFQLVRERRRPAYWSYLLPVLLLCAYVFFNKVSYGLWLPSSATAKVEQGMSGLWGRWPTAFLHVRYLVTFFKGSVYVLPLGFLLAAFGMRREKWSPMNRVLIPFGILLGGFYVFFNITNYHWYYAPFIFFTAIYAVRGLPSNRIAKVCLGLVIAECFVSSIFLLRNAQPPPNYVAMGDWLRTNTEPDAKIAAVEIGTLGWYSDRYTDDLLGLTNPVNARRVMRRDWTSWLPEQRPDYVVTHEMPAFGEIAAVKSDDYEEMPVHFGPVHLFKRKDSSR